MLSNRTIRSGRDGLNKQHKMHKAIETVIARPDIRKKMEDLGLEILPPDQRTPAYFGTFLKEDIDRWGKVIKAAGISVD